jgi:hypothetical protein
MTFNTPLATKTDKTISTRDASSSMSMPDRAAIVPPDATCSTQPPVVHPKKAS